MHAPLPSPAAHRDSHRLRTTSVAVGVAFAAAYLMPGLFEYGYTDGDGAGCDLGSLGAALFGAGVAVVAMVAVVVAAARALRRFRVLAALPGGLAAVYTLNYVQPGGPAFSPCGVDYSAAAALLLFGCGAGLVYLLGRAPGNREDQERRARK